MTALSQTLEFVTFSLIEGASEDAFAAAAAEIGDWAKTQPGFQYRALVRREDGVWMDMVFWADPDAARTASAKFMAAMGACAAMRMIDPASVAMAHLPVRSNAAPAAMAA